ncbi:MAG: hypothetical protein IPM57_12065 [Oligoflexia bacterium]|nr:hypothetical protein [Oligoflexia bacterium]
MHFAKLFLSLVVLFSFGCKNTNEITPIAGSKKLKFNAISLNIQGDVEPVKVQKSFIRKFTGTLLGWIPLFGEILEMPINLSLSMAKALIPPLPVRNDIPIKPGSTWTDEEVLKLVKSVQLTAGYLEVIEREKKNLNILGPSNPNDLNFLKDVHVSLIFRDKNGEVLEDIPLADAIIEKDFIRDTQRLHFHTTNVDIKPYYEKYKTLEIRTLASGKFPNYDITFNGKFNVLVVLDLPQPF